jgi:hypothetical protein
VPIRFRQRQFSDLTHEFVNDTPENIARMAGIVFRSVGYIVSSGSDYCYIKFGIAGEESFQRLASVVRELADDRNSGRRRDDAEWRKLFTENDLQSFWWPTLPERQEWWDHWWSTPVPERLSYGMPRPPWDFDSMIDAIFNAEYVLLGVRRLTVSEAVLEFDPQAWPYGGADSLRALVRSFGHQINGFENGTGYVEGDPLPPLWTPSCR